jgi:hypothetical protein
MAPQIEVLKDHGDCSSADPVMNGQAHDGAFNK